MREQDGNPESSMLHGVRNYRRILAVVEFSDTGAAVIRRAHNLARLEGAELALLHLVAPDPTPDGGYPPPSRLELEQGFEQPALRRLAFLKGTLGVDKAELFARYGQPERGYEACIAHWQPDLVVAGDDPGYLGGRHDLLTLGRTGSHRGVLRQLLRWFMVPAGLLHGA